jgi:23S rRNA (guanine745-N1)-methyltransferase
MPCPFDERVTIAILTESYLACSVRDCALPLTRRERALVCPRGHSHDVARSGYISLLQPQDRRSRVAGDSKAAVAARSRLLDAGVGREILEGFVSRAAALDLNEDAVVVDLGSGSGDGLGALASTRPITGVGIDLSAAAAAHAARRFPALTWIVANADRRLPLLDHSVELVLSLHARRNPAECARVLTSTGRLLIAAPAHDDLIELRSAVYGRAVERERAGLLIDEHASAFTLVDRTTIREHHHLTRDALQDLLRGTYRGERTSTTERVNALTSLDVTLASELFLLTKR